MGFWPGEKTIERCCVKHGTRIHLVTHDVLKYFRLVLKRNGYVLEPILSPLIVFTTPAHEELKALTPGCITAYLSHHYLGFASTQWGLFEKQDPPRVKPLLYVYRVLLTGIQLMRTGEVEANLLKLSCEFKPPLHPGPRRAQSVGRSGRQD